MNEASARKLIGEFIQSDGALKATDTNWIIWPLRPDGKTICVDGYFTAEELEALAWWIRNRAVPMMPPEKPWFLSK